jgi:hypothetical protein
VLSVVTNKTANGKKRLNQQSRTASRTMVGRKHTPAVKKSGQPDDARLGNDAL